MNERREVIRLIEETCKAGARRSRACHVLAISARTLQRWREDGQVKADGRKEAAGKREPVNKLSAHERQQILDIANGCGSFGTTRSDGQTTT